MFKKKEKKAKKPFFKRVWVWVLGGIIVISIASGGGEETPEETTAAPEAKTADAQPKEEVKKEEPKKEEAAEVIGKLNEPFKVGEVTFTVTGSNTTKNVGGEFGVDSQGTFLVLDVIVKNESKEALTVDSSFFSLESEGATYDADSSADIYANDAGKSFFLQEINPNLELKGKVVFDVTEAVIADPEKFVNVQTGFWGTETGKIKLK